MDNDKKSFNFYFPDNSICELRVEDKPVNKLTFLPEQQPLIFDSHGKEKYLCDESEFIYQPITKVACKTIKTWMMSLLKKDKIDEVGEVKFGEITELQHLDNTDFNIHDICVKVFGGVNNITDNVDDRKRKISFYQNHIKKVDQQNFEFTDEVNDYFKFTFVRNPWTRIISAYMEKFRNQNGNYKPAIEINNLFKDIISVDIPKYFKEYFDKDNILSFDGFVDIFYQFSKRDYDNFDIHWMPQHIINDMYIKKYDFIGKLENFKSDFDKILETLNIKIKPKYKIGSNSHLYQKHYKFYKDNPELIDKVAEIYKEDIKRYNYDFSDLEK